MELQAKEYLLNREWNKAADLYNKLLLTKPYNKDLIISYLFGRSECLLELGQHEAVITDCRKIIKLLAENKESGSPSGARARSRLVHALFALQRYGDAELATREWLSLSKSSEAPKLLEKLHIAMHESQQKALKEAEIEFPRNDVNCYCPFCNISCKDKAELRAHCQSQSHQIIIMSDEGRDWHCRPPPRGLNASDYSLCMHWHEKGSCRYGSQCVEAHGAEELSEWKQRYRYREMKLQRACEKELFGKSYTEQLLERCMQATPPSTIMSEQIALVEDKCCSNLVTTVLSKTSTKKWTFTLMTNRVLQAVALLHDVHRSNFEISEIVLFTNQTAIKLEIKNNQEWLVAAQTESLIVKYEVTLLFKTDIYGTFRQSVIFDFGGEPVLVKNMCVDVIPEHEAEKIKHIREEIVLTSAERWTPNNTEIVSYTSANSSYTFEDELNGRLLSDYRCPQVDTLCLSHATVMERKLTANNYRTRLHELLYIEEMARNEQTNKFNITVELHLVSSYILFSSSLSNSTAKYSNFGELFAYLHLTKDLSADTLCGRLILNSCKSVLIGLDKPQSEGRPKVYEALIEDKGKNIVYLRLSAATVNELNLTPRNSFIVHIQFQLNRIPYCEWHYAVDRMPNLKLIFPETYREPLIPWSPQKQWYDNVDNRLNLKQKEAVIAITTPLYVPLPPILIIGPFGTGKTFTLAQAIKQIMKQEGSRVLICTHSNSAADLYIKDYLDPYVKDGHEEARPLRVYYQGRWVATVHPVVQQYCLIEESGIHRSFEVPRLSDIEKHRIVVVTVSTSIYLSNMGLPQGYFTHILLDEAAQTIECEAIMPLSLANENTRIVLAGDHMQLSPELFSRFAKERDLHVSLLERLYEEYPGNFPCKILLRENYRAHEAIIEFTSELFYEQKLVASGKQPRHHTFYPLTFFTARGEDVQDKYSTAFYNNAEAYEIVERVCELKRQWPKAWGKFDDQSIGIMTPYADQVFRIRAELRKRRLGSISVERVLNVQGKQFRAIFLSTVRTRRTCTNSESTGDESDYGFLSNSKLLNTAITRAQSLVAVVGDPVALCTVGRCSKVWERFIQVCDENSSLFGITWSYLKNQLDGLELKKTYGLNPLAPEFVPRKYKTEAYIKLPPVRKGYPQPYGYTSPNYCGPKQGVPVMWPVYRPPSNYMWGMPSMHPSRVLPNSNGRQIQNHEMVMASPQPQPQPTPPVYSTSNVPISRPLGISPRQQNTPANQHEPPSMVPPERDLIQFLDNVHIPEGVKKNSDSLHDLINLLPEEMSLATVLLQPPAFHKQWFHYLLAKKGIEAAKKFEYLMIMSTKKDRQNNAEPRRIDWDSICTDMLKSNINHDASSQNLMEGTFRELVDPNWFDRPVDQINFDKPVYLKDPLHIDGMQQQRPSGPACSQNDFYRPNFTNGVYLQFDQRESVPLYQRQCLLQNQQEN